MGSTDIPHTSHVLSGASLFVHVKKDDLTALPNEDNLGEQQLPQSAFVSRRFLKFECCT